MVTNLILLAIGIAFVVYFWRGLNGGGWNLPLIDPSSWGGGGFRMPSTRGAGDALGCKWSGSC